MSEEKRLTRLMREPEVYSVTGLSNTQRKAAILRGEFPAPVLISDGGRAVGWFEDEILRWLEARRAARVYPSGKSYETGPKPSDKVAAE